jgi:5-methylcytosine-specific restriction endonuclease McrA
MTRRCYKCGEDKKLGECVRDKRKPSGYGYQCKRCMREHSRRWYASNTTRVNSGQAEYYAANRSGILERRKHHHRRETEEERSKRRAANGDYKRYRRENQEKHNAAMRRWNERHPDYYADYRRSHRLETAQKGRRWIARNRERYLANSRRSRARRRGAGGDFTAEQWVKMKERYQYTCLCCGKVEPEIRLTVDHVIPIVKDGRHAEENIRPLCGSCNNSKGIRTTDYRVRWSDVQRGRG